MADLRDFTPSQDDSAPRFVDGPIGLSEPIRNDVVIIDDGGLGDFHVSHEAEEEGNNRSKLFAGLAVAVLVGIGGAYTYSQYASQQPVVADNALPKPSAVTNAPAMTPPAPAPAVEDEATAAAPAATSVPDASSAAPVIKQAAIANTSKSASNRSTPSSSANDTGMTAAQTPAPVAAPDNQAASTVEPGSPTAPATSVAGNPALNQQSAEPQADQAPAPSQDTAPATQPEAAAPAQPDAAAQPAPAPADPAPATPAQ